MRDVELAFCWCFEDADPILGLQTLASLGYDGFELWPDALTAHPAGDWKLAMHESGMRCVQLCPYFDFVHGQERTEQSEASLRLFLQYAQELECQRLRVFTGPPWGEGVVSAAEATET